jgi:hypothetical protein
MGATVTTGKRAAAFKTAAGNIIYVLFEETYEKNCYPHTPRWSCVFFGSIEQALKRIFLSAASCEGGMLKGKGGDITPEAYIAGWMKELTAPAPFRGEGVDLQVGKSFYSAVQEESAEKVYSCLAEQGRQDVIDVLKGGGIYRLNFADEGNLAASLSQASVVYPWRLVDAYSCPSGDVRQLDFGYAPKPVKDIDLSVPEFIWAGDECLLIKTPDGAWRAVGYSAYSIDYYIRDLWELELKEPGSYRKRIGAYRAACVNAPRVPLIGCRVRIDLTRVAADSFEASRMASLRNELPVTETSEGFEILVTEEIDGNNLWHIQRLSAEAAVWTLSEEPCSKEVPQASTQLSFL